MEKKFPTCNALYDENKEINTHRFCAPIFISNGVNLLIGKQEELIGKGNDNLIRNGTVTFVEHKGEFFAVTCAHVVSVLNEERAKNRKRWLETFPHDFLGFFTIKNGTAFHLNYEFRVLINEENKLDVAIARIEKNIFERIEREAIKIKTIPTPLPEAAIACGYPEEQRVLRQKDKLQYFAPKGVNCVGSLGFSKQGEIFINDEISNHNKVDNLSGMSGGPLIWFNETDFGLAGIIKYGYDIQPKKDGISKENALFIRGSSVSFDLFEEWLKDIPPLNPIFELTKKTLYS